MQSMLSRRTADPVVEWVLRLAAHSMTVLCSVVRAARRVHSNSGDREDQSVWSPPTSATGCLFSPDTRGAFPCLLAEFERRDEKRNSEETE